MSVTTARSGRSRQAPLPSVMLKETPVDPSVFDKRDPLEKFLDKQKGTIRSAKRAERLTEYDENIEDESENQKRGRIDVSNMSLDNFLNKYTSEDNKSFQVLHDRDR